MTCIAGTIKNGIVCIGADSANVGGQTLIIRKDPKLFRKADLIIGCTSSYRMIQIIRYEMQLPVKHVGDDAFDYMCQTFVPQLRGALRNGGYMEISDNRESGGSMLVGGYGRLFMIDSDFQVCEAADNYLAVGCGESFALGAMHACNKSLPRDIVAAGLEAAAYYSTGVSAPFLFEYDKTERL